MAGDDLQSVDSLRAKHAINGDNKGNKSATLFKTLLLAFSFLVLLSSNENFLRIFVDV